MLVRFFIVYLFPKSGKFKYNFDKGKPWQSENLLAPFDFAINKSAEELEKEAVSITGMTPNTGAVPANPAVD